jgi:hypothetical protein
MTVPWIIATIVAALWLVVALLQLGDVATVFLDSRTARDREASGRIARERTNGLFWVPGVVAVLAVGIGLGLDHVSRLFFDGKNPSLGTLFLLGVAVIVVAVGGLAFAAVAATDRTSYAALRRELRDAEGERLTAAQVARFRALLESVDARTRSSMRQTRATLTPAGVVRLVPIGIGLLVLAATIVAAAITPTPDSASLIALSVAPPVLSAIFASLGIRFSVVSDRAWRRVYAKQRVDIIKLLEVFDRGSRKRVAGLGDRVTRALQILREQQP